MKLAGILDTYYNLTGLANRKLPVKLSYTISRNLSMLEGEAKAYDEQRKKLCEENAEKDEAGKPVISSGKYEISEKNRKRFEQDLSDLLNEEINIEFRKVPASVLDQMDDPRYDPLSAADMSVLEIMIEG